MFTPDLLQALLLYGDAHGTEINLNTELIAIHAVRTEDVLYETRNMLTDIETANHWRSVVAKSQGGCQNVA